MPHVSRDAPPPQLPLIGAPRLPPPRTQPNLLLLLAQGRQAGPSGLWNLESERAMSDETRTDWRGACLAHSDY